MLRTIAKLRENGYMNQYPSLTGEEVFSWWISKEGIAKWYAKHKQPTLFEDETD